MIQVLHSVTSTSYVDVNNWRVCPRHEIQMMTVDLSTFADIESLIANSLAYGLYDTELGTRLPRQLQLAWEHICSGGVTSTNDH